MLKNPHQSFKILTYSIGSVFNEKLKNNKDNFLKEVELQKEFDNLLQLNSKEFALKFLDSGYQLTQNQFIFLIEKKQDWFRHYYEEKDFFNKYFLNNHQQDIKDYIKKTTTLLKKTNFLINKAEKNKLIELDNKIDAIKFIVYNFTDIFTGENQIYHDIKNSLSILQKKLPKKQKKDEGYIRMVDDGCLECEKALDKNYLIFCQNHLDKKIQEIKEFYLENDLLKNITKNFEKEIKNYNEKSFTPENWQLIKQIKSLHDKINISNLDEEQKWHITNIFEKKLPQACRDFLGISQEYREKLKTMDGKNAQDLFNQSLMELKNDLEQIVNYQENQNLNQLHITQRYIANTKIKSI